VKHRGRKWCRRGEVRGKLIWGKKEDKSNGGEVDSREELTSSGRGGWGSASPPVSFFGGKRTDLSVVGSASENGGGLRKGTMTTIRTTTYPSGDHPKRRTLPRSPAPKAKSTLPQTLKKNAGLLPAHARPHFPTANPLRTPPPPLQLPNAPTSPFVPHNHPVTGLQPHYPNPPPRHRTDLQYTHHPHPPRQPSNACATSPFVIASRLHSPRSHRHPHSCTKVLTRQPRNRQRPNHTRAQLIATTSPIRSRPQLLSSTNKKRPAEARAICP